MRIFLAALALPLALAGCAYADPTGGTPMPLVDGAGRTVGSVTAYQSGGGVTFRIEGAGLPHGVHGIHVHSVGRCAGPDFASAGPHWNPMSKQHGFSNPQGPHGGDLSNVTVAANGVLSATVTLANADLTAPSGVTGALLDGDGAALVLHAAADDYATDPSGQSGPRIACAVLVPTAVRY
ncbi:MAG: superoxide dismutase family protein [Pseudomonadota bacterium]